MTNEAEELIIEFGGLEVYQSAEDIIELYNTDTDQKIHLHKEELDKITDRIE